MVEIRKRYICDICGDEVTINDNENIPAWTTKTEVGDLCPTCYELWVKTKKEFPLSTLLRLVGFEPQERGVGMTNQDHTMR